GFGEQKQQRLAKPVAGHLAKVKAPGLRRLREFRDYTLDVKPGDQVGVNIFAEGDFIDAIGITKGRGFEGVVRRHHFRGGDSTHGAKGWHRRSGAIGQRLFPGTVMRGMKMPGHMGQVRRTVQNLEVVKVLVDDQILLIKGAIPGANGEFVVIRESKKRPKTTAKK
ncbi:MAG: 50S ribosomal protein L3, partial [Nitrospira sp.]|nr:50S ribosomal protein L3 [Nitrospira sp.]